MDDHVDAADLAAELLQERGHVTCVAYGSRAAITAAANFLPEIAILDICLPTMNGYELARHLRAIAFLSSCRFIAVTGNADDMHRRESEAAGFCFHLVKPFGEQALLEAVDSDDSVANARPSRVGQSVSSQSGLPN